MTNNVSKLLALVFSTAFSAGLLVTSIVIVDSWRQMEPAASIDWFATYGLLLGLVMAPMGGLAVIFSLIAFVLEIKRGDELFQKVVWLLAVTCTLGTMALLLIYFGEANTRFFEKTIALTEVAEEVENWSFWNWIRTGLSLAATTIILVGLARKPTNTHI
jgi:hypothetical protein